MNNNFNWYPGHMKKTLDIIKNKLTHCDCVFMMIDVRSYKSGYNENLTKIIKQKRKNPIVILSRKDLIPINYDKRKIHIFFNDLKIPYYYVDIINGSLQSLLEPVRKSKEIVNKRFVETNFRPTIMIVGMPNSGKSSYINALKKRASAKVANIPGITRNVSLFTIKNLASIIDTPGVFIPNKIDENRAYPLHLVRAIRKEIIPLYNSIYWALEMLYSFSFYRYKEIALKFNFNYKVPPNKDILKELLGPIQINKLYTFLSGTYSFIWDY